MSAAAPPTSLGGQLREYCGPFCVNPWTQKILLLSGSALFLIFMQILNTSGVDVYVLGILPRTAEGLAGLIGAPWVHVSWSHLIGNLIGWFTLGLLVLLHGRRPFGLLYAWLSVVGGFAVWVVARPVRHVGLSGVIFGFFGFLLFAALWQRPIKASTIIGLVVAILIYGGTMLSGVLIPNMELSWESHVCGFIAGVVWALLYFRFLLRNPRFCEIMGKELPEDMQGGQGGPQGTELPVTTASGQERGAASQQPWWKLGMGGSGKAPASSASGPASAPNPTYGGAAAPAAPPTSAPSANPYQAPAPSSGSGYPGANPYANPYA